MDETVKAFLSESLRRLHAMYDYKAIRAAEKDKAEKLVSRMKAEIELN